MKKYIKPSVININDKSGILPLAALGVGLVEAGAAAAFAGGVAYGMLKGDDRNSNGVSLKALPECI